MSGTRNYIEASSQVSLPEAATPVGFNPVNDTFVVPTDGATVFTLSFPVADVDNFKLSLNGQLARRTVDYSVVGTTLTWLPSASVVLQAEEDDKPGPTDVLSAYYYT